MRDCYVYILASKSRELYIGVTNNLTRRMAEHRAGVNPDDHAYRHEIELIESVNPKWLDLASAPSPRSG